VKCVSVTWLDKIVKLDEQRLSSNQSVTLKNEHRGRLQPPGTKEPTVLFVRLRVERRQMCEARRGESPRHKMRAQSAPREKRQRD
jgi:hypothetical protein